MNNIFMYPKNGYFQFYLSKHKLWVLKRGTSFKFVGTLTMKVQIMEVLLYNYNKNSNPDKSSICLLIKSMCICDTVGSDTRMFYFI